MLKLFLFIFGLFLNILLPKQASAIAKFDTSYQIYYKVLDSGKTHVTIAVSQKNNLSVVFATEYGISLSQTKIDNVKVSDDGLLVIPDVNKGEAQTTISFPFAKKVVGKDKIHKFSIEYDTDDIAFKNGNTWQINIPRFETDENITEQTAILIVPESFQKPAYIDPKPDIVNGNTYYFSSKILANKPISAIFGSNQYYKANLKYNLQNEGTQKVNTDIAIPPLTGYQTVYIEKLDPMPEKVYQDIDGNLLATYKLNPKETKTVTLNQYFRMNFQSQVNFAQDPGNNLGSNKIWDHNHINFTAAETKFLTSPKSIYDFVAGKLKYDFQKINSPKLLRASASKILSNPQSAICTDYTDLFVSLARRAGIPARELEGMAISDNPALKPVFTSETKDILHAWPEYFDKENLKWIQIDPTWSSTTKGIDYFNKLDFNHIVFVIHGQDPEYPVSAGGYKLPGQNTKDIQIAPVPEITFPKPDLKISYKSRLSNQLVFEIENSSGVYFQGNVTVEENADLFKQVDFMTIAPFSKSEIKVYLKEKFRLGAQSDKAIIVTSDNSQEIRYTILPKISKGYIFAGLGVVLVIITFFTRSLLLRRRK